MKKITIPKGDDTGAFGIRRLLVKLDESCIREGMTATFSLLSFTKDFTAEEVATGELDIELGSSTTASFPLGTFFGSLRLYDADARLFTVTGRIPFEVVPAGSGARIPGDGVTVQTLSFATDVVTIRVGFAVDYADMENKPTINGVDVSGEKTGDDFGLASTESLDGEIERAVSSERLLAASIEEVAGAILDEKGRAIEAEGALSASVDGTREALAAEIARAKARENAIEASIPADVSQKLAEETARAKGAEKVIANSVVSEQVRASGVENKISSDLETETKRAREMEYSLVLEDQRLSEAIVAETLRAKDVEANLRMWVTRALVVKVTNVLPAEGVEGILYLVPSPKPSAKDAKSEYMWVDGRWECVGSTELDLSDYVKEKELAGVRKEAEAAKTAADAAKTVAEAADDAAAEAFSVASEAGTTAQKAAEDAAEALEGINGKVDIAKFGAEDAYVFRNSTDENPSGTTNALTVFASLPNGVARLKEYLPIAPATKFSSDLLESVPDALKFTEVSPYAKLECLYTYDSTGAIVSACANFGGNLARVEVVSGDVTVVLTNAQVGVSVVETGGVRSNGGWSILGSGVGYASDGKTIGFYSVSGTYYVDGTSSIIVTPLAESPSKSVMDSWDGKQDELVSGTTIKTIHNKSVLGSGDIVLSAADIKTESGTTVEKALSGIMSLVPSGEDGVYELISSPVDEEHIRSR